MSQRSYKATGINLKGMPMGESDRLVTVLTKEYGLVRAIAPGARKHKSKLAGRSGLFVVNDVFLIKGKSIDKLVQAETVRSFPGLSKDLAKLTASQYLAEIALSQALSGQPQEDLYYLLLEHLTRLEAAAKPHILACLAQATFHLLALAGVAPEVFRCCLSRSPLSIDLSDPEWKVGFSVSSGGAVALSEIERMERDRLAEISQFMAQQAAERNALKEQQQVASSPLSVQPIGQPTGQPTGQQRDSTATAAEPAATYRLSPSTRSKVSQEVARNLGVVTYLSAAEIALMQQLSKPQLLLTAPSTRPPAPPNPATSDRHNGATAAISSQIAAQSGTIGIPASSEPHLMWRHIEKALRHYVQYQIDRPIRSAALIDSCFISPEHASPA
ncbi:MAG: DNA repair protein RecO [Cyanobacteria bacterium J06626_6]